MAMFSSLRHGQAGELNDLRLRRERELDRVLSSGHRRLLQILEEAGREPVSLAQLERAGISSPATLIYELEIAGKQIEHVHQPGPTGHRRLVGFRLLPDENPAPSNGRRHLLGAFRRG